MAFVPTSEGTELFNDHLVPLSHLAVGTWSGLLSRVGQYRTARTMVRAAEMGKRDSQERVYRLRSVLHALARKDRGDQPSAVSDKSAPSTA